MSCSCCNRRGKISCSRCGAVAWSRCVRFSLFSAPVRFHLLLQVTIQLLLLSRQLGHWRRRGHEGAASTSARSPSEPAR